MNQRWLWVAALGLLFTMPFANAQALDNQGALQGITQAKVIFDINVGDPGLLLTRMKLIDTTYNQLKAAGVRAEFVLAVRGRASLYLTRIGKYLGTEQKDAQTRMGAWVDHFTALGFRIEQCALAAAMLDIDPEDFLPAVKVVENGYISLIGYQQQGFALVPMD